MGNVKGRCFGVRLGTELTVKNLGKFLSFLATNSDIQESK